MQPEPKQPAPASDDAAPLGESIAIVPGSFDTDTAHEDASVAESSPPAPHQPTNLEHHDSPKNIELPNAAGTRIIQPLSDITRSHPITEKIDPSNWFKADTTPVKKRTFLTKLSLQIHKHRRIYAASLALAIMLVWGGVFAYFAVQGKQAQPGKGTPESQILVPSSATGQNEGDVTDVTVPAVDEPNPSASGTETGNNDTGQLVVSGNDDSRPDSTPAASPQHQTYAVSFTSSCFTPSSLTIKNGDTVTFTNNSNKNMWPASDPHPNHSLYPEFDPGRDIAPGANWSFTFSKSGTWGYHDHNKPSCHGTIIVNS